MFGPRGIEALSDLLMYKLVQAVDEETYTTGIVRNEDDTYYHKNASAMISQNFPWIQTKENGYDENANYIVGNLLVAKKDKTMLLKMLRNFKKRIFEIHRRGLNSNVLDRDTWVLSSLIYRSTLKEKTKE